MDKDIIPDKEDNSNQLLKPINLTGSKLFLQILEDWHPRLRKYHLRPFAYREIDKVLSCGAPLILTNCVQQKRLL
ncbi:MAG: hypothetical protein IJ719_19350 [Clostridia bacterium]|nr:hypothetical protein [Clostridia bacterium]